MADSFSKREKQKKKIQKQKEKALRREERKEDNNKGKSFEDMIVYVDAYGNLTDTKPNPEDKIEVNVEDISILPPTIEEETIKTGIVSFYSEKGYGFITENNTRENLFFHNTNCVKPVKRGDKVSFDKEKTNRGYTAINIQIV